MRLKKMLCSEPVFTRYSSARDINATPRNYGINEVSGVLQRRLSLQALCSLQVSVQQREPAKIRVNLGFMRSQKALSPAQVLSPISAQIYI